MTILLADSLRRGTRRAWRESRARVWGSKMLPMLFSRLKVDAEVAADTVV